MTQVLFQQIIHEHFKGTSDTLNYLGERQGKNFPNGIQFILPACSLKLILTEKKKRRMHTAHFDLFITIYDLCLIQYTKKMTC